LGSFSFIWSECVRFKSQLLWNHYTHPMREDVKQKHFSTPLRETSIGACIQAPSLRGEAFGSNVWSGHRVRQGYGSQLLVSLEWFHVAVPTPFVAKLRKPALGLSVPTIILCEARGLWLFRVMRGGIGLTRRLGAA
jgi:hypothetical protein